MYTLPSMEQKPVSKRQKAMLNLAYYALDGIMFRVQDDNGYFAAHYIGTLEACFTAYVQGQRCWPKQILLVWTILKTDCKPDHPMVTDEDRRARLKLMRKIRTFSRKSGSETLAEITNLEIA